MLVSKYRNKSRDVFLITTLGLAMIIYSEELSNILIPEFYQILGFIVIVCGIIIGTND
jgi:hypothetical protein